MWGVLASLVKAGREACVTFQFGELGVAAVVAGFVDECFGLGEIALGEVVVGEVETHAGACGDAEDFVEVSGCAARE